MQNYGSVCPICCKELPVGTNWCWHCGSDLHGMKLARPKARIDLYSIVPDGPQFGIALAGEIKIHGLDLKRAENLLKILNSITNTEEAG